MRRVALAGTAAVGFLLLLLWVRAKYIQINPHSADQVNGPAINPFLSSAPFNALVREEQPVIVDGTAEIWRLEWKALPKSYCGPDDEEYFTQRCAGFAFGEAGPLDLIRLVSGGEVDRFPLTPLPWLRHECTCGTRRSEMGSSG